MSDPKGAESTVWMARSRRALAFKASAADIGLDDRRGRAAAQRHLGSTFGQYRHGLRQ